MNFRLVCQLLALLLGSFSLSILTAVPFALYYGEWSSLAALAEAMATGLIVSGVLYLIGKNAPGQIYRRETLATVGLSWILSAAIGGLPFYFHGMIPSFSSAYFESMSGLTTTGASILTVIEDHPKSMLYWRSFLHFLGGLGIVVLFVAVLPLVGVGGRALFKQEVPGPVPEGLTPRIKDTAKALLRLYVALNVAEAICLMIAGMSFYEAVNHAMATMATGGFSTRNSSIVSFQSPAIEWIVIVFMYLSGMNFTLHLGAVKGKFAYWKSAEFRVYTYVILCSALFITVLLFVSGTPAVSHAGSVNFRDSLFAVLSMQTTTGFGTMDFDQWPEAARLLLVFLMFVGGCAGSTGGGMKVIRWVILFKIAAHEMASNVAPRRVTVLKVDNRPVGRAVIQKVLTFLFFYAVITAIGAVTIGLLEPESSLLTSLTAVVATLNNIGPGLEAVGPTANYAFFGVTSLWILSLLMVLGRLELFAILVLFSPSFWKQA